MNPPSTAIHKGPHPGMLAVLYTVLFCVGLYPVTALYKKPYWPGPLEPASAIVPYFQTYGARVLFCLVLQLGAMICLGLFTATVVSRLRFLGARAAGAYIALLGPASRGVDKVRELALAGKIPGLKKASW